jgi:wyosine [tRNA(Phe)-imidazoG37] synthetase (radical SAM superfamily)
MQVERRAFYEPEEILDSVRDKVSRTKAAGESIDYLAFVPDGEPTLDIHLGTEIDLLRSLGYPIAVISNASLIDRHDVREDLAEADWVSLKIDAMEEKVWQAVSRPHGSLKLVSILEGGLEFAEAYGGEMATETMLVAGMNDGEEHLRAVASHLENLRPAIAYLSLPTRPPAEKWAHAPDESTLNRAYQFLAEKVERVETLTGYEGTAFAFTGDVERDLLAITAVHPMREDAVSDYLARAGSTWSVVQRLMAESKLVEVEHGGHTFYLRRLRVPSGSA